MESMDIFNGEPPTEWIEVRLSEDYEIQSDAGACAIALAGTMGLQATNQSLRSTLDVVEDVFTRPDARPYPIGGSWAC